MVFPLWSRVMLGLHSSNWFVMIRLVIRFVSFVRRMHWRISICLLERVCVLREVSSGRGKTWRNKLVVYVWCLAVRGRALE